MNSVFRSDINNSETSLFLKNTFILPSYLNDQVYQLPKTDVQNIINEVKESSEFQRRTINMKDNIFTEIVMKRCFNKCRAFVLEDWIDYDELDCTMKCTLLHRKSFETMKDVFKNI
jgi:hypothetical protein